MFCAIGCHGNDAAADAVACDAHCWSGCTIQGTGKCDSECYTGYLLNTSNYVCMGLSLSLFLWWEG